MFKKIIKNLDKTIYFQNRKNKLRIFNIYKLYFIKLFFIIVLFFFLIIYLKNNKFKYYKKIDIDNYINYNIYEENIDFSNYSSNIKIIALYLPIYYYTKENCFTNYSNKWANIKNSKPFYKGHHQPRVPGDKKNYLEYYDLTNPEVIKRQVQLAKKHGIYGFGIYYYIINEKIFFEKPLNVYYRNKDIKFPYLLVLKIKNVKMCNTKNKEIKLKDFIENIKKYLKDERYIKINGKPAIGINDPLKIKNLTEYIFIWKQKAKKLGIGKIFILISYNSQNSFIINKINLFDAFYENIPDNLDKSNLIKTNNFIYYSGVIYKNDLNFRKNNNKYPIYRCSIVEWDNSPYKKYSYYFGDYSPEKFYILNKLLIEWSKNNNNKIIFINSWNNWNEGSYLEPDEKYGYASINSLSYALFNLPFRNVSYNISNLIIKKKIAVQAHVYYDDLINEIIDKTNNIPVKFDLFITTNSYDKKEKLFNIIKQYSKADKYYFKIVKNKGRDVLPLLIQMKYLIKKYKYICHIHSKKTRKKPLYGERWRKYLYNNLIGSKEIVSEILTDFENSQKLGFIFPETFYDCLQVALSNKKINLYINFIINKIFPGYSMGKKLDFPAGNMFWAKTSSIYQIFKVNIEDKVPEEKYISAYTIMHAIERTWLYLVKLNGYYYKKIFKHY